MLLKENEKSALIELKTILQAKYGLIDFKIYGSKARGEDTAESDIDVMIELSKVNPSIESEIDNILFTINLRHDCLISAIIFGEEELTKGPMDESPLYKAIERDGVQF